MYKILPIIFRQAFFPSVSYDIRLDKESKFRLPYEMKICGCGKIEAWLLAIAVSKPQSLTIPTETYKMVFM